MNVVESYFSLCFLTSHTFYIHCFPSSQDDMFLPIGYLATLACSPLNNTNIDAA